MAEIIEPYGQHVCPNDCGYGKQSCQCKQHTYWAAEKSKQPQPPSKKPPPIIVQVKEVVACRNCGGSCWIRTALGISPCSCKTN